MSVRWLFLSAAVAAGAGAATAADWPQWRGPNRDNHVAGFTAPATWPAQLTRKWNVPVGLGDASPALVRGRLYTFTRQGDEETITCLDAESGREIWKDHYPAVAVTGPAGQHAGPRATPAVAEGKVCTLGVGGVVSCLEADTGKVLWRKDTQAWPQFFTSSSPLILDGKCIVQLGARGMGSLTAFDLATGEEKWKWAGEGPGYGSPVVATLAGVKQVIALTEGALAGIAAEDGKPLWRTPFTTGRYSTSTPMVDGSTLICAGRSLKIEKQGDTFAVADGWKGDPPASFNTPVLKDGLLYGLSPRRNLYCQNAQTGELVWTDMTARGECGAVLDAGPVLLALTSDSNLVVFKPGKEYAEVAKYAVAETPTWAYPIVDGNRIYVKDRNGLTLWTLP